MDSGLMQVIASIVQPDCINGAQGKVIFIQHSLPRFKFLLSHSN